MYEFLPEAREELIEAAVSRFSATVLRFLCELL